MILDRDLLIKQGRAVERAIDKASTKDKELLEGVAHLLASHVNDLNCKLEAIRYCIDGLLEGKALSPLERERLFAMRRDIDKMLKPFEGVTHVQSDNVGC